jgi:hypothetical protein
MARIEEFLRLAGLARKIVNLRKAQVPALVEFRFLGLSPEALHVAVNEDFDVDALGAHGIKHSRR